jgi:hypothetical protein
VPDKSALEDLILEAVMLEVETWDDDRTASAEERVVSAAYVLRDALLAHPHAVPIALSRSLRTPGQLKPVEVLLGLFYDLGLSPTDAIAAVEVIGHYVFGATLAYANNLAAGERASEAPEESEESGITPETFPNLIRTMQEAEYVGWDGMFDRGLRALIRGVVVERMPSSGATRGQPPR